MRQIDGLKELIILHIRSHIFCIRNAHYILYTWLIFFFLGFALYCFAIAVVIDDDVWLEIEKVNEPSHFERSN